MRCTKCGWPNVSGAQICSKCGAALSSTETVPNLSSADGIKKTVSESEVFGNSNNPSTCPKCGYPLRPGVDNCPNCNFSLRTGVNPRPASSVAPQIIRRPTRLDNSQSSGLGFKGTVNPYMVDMELPVSFVLKPVKRASERHELEEKEFDGKTVTLNRDNTEPNNSSITSKEQAIISNVDGQWYIEDRSEQHTTFVQASSPTPLKDGDLILLGNRLFEFHE